MRKYSFSLNELTSSDAHKELQFLSPLSSTFPIAIKSTGLTYCMSVCVRMCVVVCVCIAIQPGLNLHRNSWSFHTSVGFGKTHHSLTIWSSLYLKRNSTPGCRNQFKASLSDTACQTINSLKVSWYNFRCRVRQDGTKYSTTSI